MSHEMMRACVVVLINFKIDGSPPLRASEPTECPVPIFHRSRHGSTCNGNLWPEEKDRTDRMVVMVWMMRSGAIVSTWLHRGRRKTAKARGELRNMNGKRHGNFKLPKGKSIKGTSGQESPSRVMSFETWTRKKPQFQNVKGKSVKGTTEPETHPTHTESSPRFLLRASSPVMKRWRKAAAETATTMTSAIEPHSFQK